MAEWIVGLGVLVVVVAGFAWLANEAHKAACELDATREALEKRAAEADAAERRAREAEARADAAERRANKAHARADVLELRAKEAYARAEEAELQSVYTRIDGFHEMHRRAQKAEGERDRLRAWCERRRAEARRSFNAAGPATTPLGLLVFRAMSPPLFESDPFIGTCHRCKSRMYGHGRMNYPACCTACRPEAP